MSWCVTLAISLATLAAAVPEDATWKLQAGDAAAAQQKVDELVRFADGADTALEQFDARLAAANGLLSIVLAPVASRRLLDIPTNSDPAEARRILQAAREHLDRAARLLATASAEPDVERARIAARRERLGGVRAFAAVFHAIWRAPVGGETSGAAAAGDSAAVDSAALRHAMMELAMVMEDHRPEVAQAARLWRAYLFSREGDTSRALDLLPLALEPPSGDASVALFARLLRCKLFVRVHDGYGAAFALLARLERRVNTWFDSPADQAAARRTVALERRRLTQAWGRAFTAAGKTERAAWCKGAVARLDGEYFADAKAHDLLPLAWAAPPVVALDIPKPASTAPDGEDAAKGDAASAGFEQE